MNYLLNQLLYLETNPFMKYLKKSTIFFFKNSVKVFSNIFIVRFKFHWRISMFEGQIIWTSKISVSDLSISLVKKESGSKAACNKETRWINFSDYTDVFKVNPIAYIFWQLYCIMALIIYECLSFIMLVILFIMIHWVLCNNPDF